MKIKKIKQLILNSLKIGQFKRKNAQVKRRKVEK
jgi:hypothetical protein